jgi:hypothetical protein
MVGQTGVTVEIVGAEAPSGPVHIEQRVADVAPPAELVIGAGRYGRVRNPGHAGYSVETYRVSTTGRELLSRDTYPVMNKVVEYKPGVE